MRRHHKAAYERHGVGGCVIMLIYSKAHMQKTLTASTKHQKVCFAAAWKRKKFPGQLGAPKRRNRAIFRRLAVPMKACLQRKTLTESRRRNRTFSRRFAVPKKVCLRRKVLMASATRQHRTFQLRKRKATLRTRQAKTTSTRYAKTTSTRRKAKTSKIPSTRYAKATSTRYAKTTSTRRAKTSKIPSTRYAKATTTTTS